MNKIAIFSCGDDSYVEQMCSALLIACKHNSNFIPYIISDVTDTEKLELISKLGIVLFQVDLSKEFEIHNDTWPSHMFWYFIGPEALYKQGFEYSCYIDADVYCINKIKLEWLDGVEIAARSDKENEYNSGVVFFDNKKMTEKKLFETALNVYKKFSTDEYVNWHGGKVHDQQILTALGKGNPFNEFWGGDKSFDITDLDITWNYPFNIQNDRAKEHKNLLSHSYKKLKEKIYFAHFLLSQPWMQFKEWGSRNHGMFASEDFPKGWVVKKKHSEPNPSVRIQFVEDWREDIREIEKEYNCKLFDKFDDLKDVL